MTRAALQVATAVLLLLQGCSTANDRYAHCADLGVLRLQSFNTADAESRMLQQVQVLGGDLLLFGVRGRTVDDDVPEELVWSRDRKMQPVESIDGAQPAGVSAPEQTSDVELWYYGTVLRCGAVTGQQQLEK